MATKKETIKPPTKREKTDASKELRKGHPSGGRVLAEASVAKRQGAAKGAAAPAKGKGTGSTGPKRK